MSCTVPHNNFQMFQRYSVDTDSIVAIIVATLHTASALEEFRHKTGMHRNDGDYLELLCVPLD